MDPNQQGWNEEESTKKVSMMTLFNNTIESSKESHYWTDNALIQAVIGIWFAASHQPWINLHFVFLELCARPEYVQQLRDEIGSEGSLDYTKISKLPILDRRQSGSTL
ncbi:hypothetical protein MMC31_007854 [Peltigera leucophlebia]|nr:hypothetical protein [Peltigera leucophlebia]